MHECGNRAKGTVMEGREREIYNYLREFLKDLHGKMKKFGALTEKKISLFPKEIAGYLRKVHSLKYAVCSFRNSQGPNEKEIIEGELFISLY